MPCQSTQLTKAIRSLEKEATSTATLKDEVDKLRSWKDIKTAEIEDLLEKVSDWRYPDSCLLLVLLQHQTGSFYCEELRASK